MPYTTHAGIRLWWEEEGSGEPLLMIMGLGATLEWWARIRPALAARYRTILFDNCGVGRSDAPPGPISIATMADDAVSVLDAAGVASAHVFGLSMGGYIAQEVVLRHPDRVRSLILACTSCGGRGAVRAAPEVVSALGDRARMTREEAARRMVPYTFDASTPRERIEEDLVIRLQANVANQAYFAQLDAIRAWGGAYDRLKDIAVPTLVIHGETDQLVPPDNGRMLARGIPNAQLVMLPDASHIFLTDQPGPARDAIMSFLERAAAGPTEAKPAV